MTTRAIQGDGTPEADWLKWLPTLTTPRMTSQQLCSDNNRLVVVAPHPDDEVLACGGLLAHRASRGLPNLIIAVTDGEASHGTPGLNHEVAQSLSPSEKLRERRLLERRQGLALLGVEPDCIMRLEVPDGKTASNSQKLVDQLQRVVQPTDVVVTTWRLDGHPDHEACADAVHRAGCRHFQAPVWMWHWATPADSRVPWEHMVALELTKQNVQLKQRALAQHRSQLEPRSSVLGPVLEAGIVQRAGRQQEYFFMNSY